MRVYDTSRCGVEQLWVTESTVANGFLAMSLMSEDGESNSSTVEDPRIDRKHGSGSLSQTEQWVDEQSQGRSALNDGRYDTRTTFYFAHNEPGDSMDRHQLHRHPRDRTSWEELASKNDGMGDSDRPMQNYDADVVRWTETFCSQLELNKTVQDRVHYVIGEIDMKDVGYGHQLSAEKAILGAISLVVDDETDVDDVEDWDLDDWIVYDDMFEELMESVGMDRSELWSLRRIIHEKSSLFDDVE